MKERKEMKIKASSNLTVNDLIAFIVTNDVANFNYAKNEVRKLKTKYRFISTVVLIYILYKEKVLDEIIKKVNK